MTGPEMRPFDSLRRQLAEATIAQQSPADQALIREYYDAFKNLVEYKPLVAGLVGTLINTDQQSILDKIKKQRKAGHREEKK